MKIRNKYVNLCNLIAVLFCLSFNSSHAQGVRPVDVQTAFANGVLACSKAVGRDVALDKLEGLEKGTISLADPNTPALLKASEGEKLYDVGPAKGIVVILVDNSKNCQIMAYGPRVLPSYALVEKELLAQSDEWKKIQKETTPDDFIERYERVESDGTYVHIFLMGGEPGMGSRMFRFPMFTADVTRFPANYLETSTTAFTNGAVLCANAMYQGISLDALPAEDLRDWTLLEQNKSPSQNYSRYGMAPVAEVVSMSSSSKSDCYIGGAWLDAEASLNAAIAKLTQSFPSLKEVSRRDRGKVKTILFTLKDANQTDILFVFTLEKIGGVAASEKRAKLSLEMQKADQQK